MSEETPRRGPGRPPKTVTDEVTTTKDALTEADVPVPDDANPELDALRAELAALRAEKEAREEATTTVAPKTGKFVIHFVRDGLTVLGNMTYRGQELEFDTNSQAYKDTLDTNGWSFLELRRDPQGQEALFGKEFFREGPWTGKSFADIKFETLKRLAGKGEDSTISARELEELDKLDQKRRRVPEPLPPISLGGSPVGKRSGY